MILDHLNFPQSSAVEEDRQFVNISQENKSVQVKEKNTLPIFFLSKRLQKNL
jgi:hypothetical protein